MRAVLDLSMPSGELRSHWSRSTYVFVGVSATHPGRAAGTHWTRAPEGALTCRKLASSASGGGGMHKSRGVLGEGREPRNVRDIGHPVGCLLAPLDLVPEPCSGSVLGAPRGAPLGTAPSGACGALCFSFS